MKFVRGNEYFEKKKQKKTVPARNNLVTTREECIIKRELF